MEGKGREGEGEEKEGGRRKGGGMLRHGFWGVDAAVVNIRRLA